jgi:hypothetical protein
MCRNGERTTGRRRRGMFCDNSTGTIIPGSCGSCGLFCPAMGT